jgi:hypothetical protein
LYGKVQKLLNGTVFPNSVRVLGRVARMRKSRKIAIVIMVAMVFAFAAFGSMINVVMRSGDGGEALAAGAGKTRLSAGLKEALGKAGRNELLRVWLEFDGTEYQSKTGTSIFSLIRQYRDSGMEKISRNARSELLAEETIATMYCYSKGVDPPVEILKEKPYLVWFVAEMDSAEIDSVIDFPGVQALDLRALSEGSPKADPILKPLIAKIAKDYPICTFTLVVDLYEQINSETGESWCNFKSVEQAIREYGGQVTECWKSLRGIAAVVPPSLQLITTLSSLGDVESISPNWNSYVLD